MQKKEHNIKNGLLGIVLAGLIGIFLLNGCGASRSGEVDSNIVNVTLSNDEEKVYVADIANQELRIVNINSPSNPTLIGKLKSVRGNPRAIALNNDTAYMVSDHKILMGLRGYGSLTIANIANADDPTKIGQYYTEKCSYWDIAISSDNTKVYIVSDKAKKGDSNLSMVKGKLDIIDISTPSNPQLIGTFKRDDNASFTDSMHGIAISPDNKKAYIAADNFLFIVDISNPSHPALLGSYYEYISFSGISLSSDGKTAYLSSSNMPIVYPSHWPGLRIIDVNDPANPVLLGKYTYEDKYKYTAIAISDDEEKAYITEKKTGLLIVDISNKSNPNLIGKYESKKSDALGIAISPDQSKVYLADGKNGLKIIAVKDPANPTLLGTYK